MASDYELLAQYFQRPVQALNPGASDVAKYILLNAGGTKPVGPGGIKKDKDSTSLMGWIFDKLSRPNYAVAEFAREWVETGDPDISAAMQGLTGEKKTTFSKVLQEAGMEHKLGRAYLGGALDIVADPLNLIPVAGIAKGLKGLKKAVPDPATFERPLGQRLMNQGEPVIPENFNLPPQAAQTIPQPLARPEEVQLTPPSVSLTDVTPHTGVVNPNKLPAQQLMMDLEAYTPKGHKPAKKPRVDEQPVLTNAEEYDFDWEHATDEEFLSGKLFSERPPVGSTKNVGPTKEVPGQLSFRFPEFSVKAARAETKKTALLAEKLSESAPAHVAKVAAGDITSALKLTPLPPQVINPKQKKLLAAAEDIAKNFDPNLAKAEINKKYPETLNAKQQAILWHKAKKAASEIVYRKGRSAKSIEAKINEDAIKIYSHVEKTYVSSGRVPRLGTGENLKLSDVLADFTLRRRPITDKVIQEFGSEIKPGSDLWKSVEILRARGAIDESKNVKLITEKIAESRTVTESSNLLSNSQLKDFDEFLKNFGKATARAEGISPAGIKATEKLIDLTLRTGKTRAQIAIEQNAKVLDDIIANGKANPKANAALTRALEYDLGNLPKWAVDDNKAVEFIMGRVATWWGQKDIRPMSLNAIGGSQATATARGKVLDNLFEPFNATQRSDAFKLAQGIGTATSQESAQLANQISRMMDNLVGQVSGSSVLLRSGVHRDMLNKWMRHYSVGFEFTNSKKAKNILGDEIDFSQGTDWVNSWKTAEIKVDPKAFLFKIQQAMEQATREKALFDDIGERFGSTFYGKEFRTKVTGYPYLDGYYFPEEIAKQLPRVIRDWSIPAWQGNSPMLSLYDRILSMWKSGVTIYRPGHHIRNMAGDIYLGWMDGVSSSRPYMLAAKVQRSMQGIYTDMANVDRLVEVGALSKGFATPRPNEILFTNKSGVPFTSEQIGAVAHQKGLLEHTNTIEDIIDLGDSGRKSVLDMKPFGGKVQKFARNASELQSHNARLAHFIDVLSKSKGNNLPELFEQAARRSRKWHPTGLDLTHFEKKVMRRVMPFYSWLRKSLPLLLEGLVMNPAKTLIPAKLSGSMQEAAGIETPGRQDPFPVDQMFPQWIKSQGMGPISTPQGMLGQFSNQQPAGYVMAGVGLNPLQDLMAQLETPAKTIGSSMTPLVQVPMELLSGRKLFTGEPISGADARPGAMEQYVGEQIPMWSMVQGITGVTPLGGETKKAAQSGSSAATEAIVNWLTAAGIRGTGPYVNQARYEANAPGQMQRKMQKEEFLSQLRGRLGE